MYARSFYAGTGQNVFVNVSDSVLSSGLCFNVLNLASAMIKRDNITGTWVDST